MSDGKEAKILILDDLHDTKVADFSKLNGIVEQWYAHRLGNNGLEVKMGAVYYAPKKLVPRGQMKNGTALLLEWEKIKENKNAENQG